MLKNVLLITYYWKPSRGPAIQRWTVFVDELIRAEVQPIVLTVRDGTYPAVDSSYDISDDPEFVYRTKTREPFKVYNWLKGKPKQSAVGLGDASSESSLFSRLGNFVRANLFIPDARKGWVPFAEQKALELIEQKEIEHIITTGPPHSTHLVGLRIKERYPKLFWMADFRDPWVNVYYNKHLLRTAYAWKKDEKLENRVLATADQVIVISGGMQREFADRAPAITTVMNGYDKQDFVENPKSLKEKQFVVSYTGNFTDNQLFDSIWSAFQEIVSEHPLGDKIIFRFTGNVSQGIQNALSHHNLADRMELHPYCPHDEAVQKMIDSDLLLLLIPIAENNELIITAKIFEYLASGTPILAIGPKKGDAANVLQKSGRPAMYDYHEKDNIKSYIAQNLERWDVMDSERFKETSQAHNQFSRNEQAKKLIAILKGQSND
jgi:glycosyltransferase involved in cell wall biosynthesis